MTNLPLIVGPVNVPWPGQEQRSASGLARVARIFTTPMEHRLHASTLRRARRILVTGASSRNALPAGVHDRCADVPFGVDTQRFTATALPSEPTILFCASLTERKGAAVLVRAMQRIVTAVPNARLILAGADPDSKRAYLEGLAQTIGASHAVEFVGDVAHDDVPALVARARVFCAPSFGEPFGMSVIEAMASARPVVGTLGGGIADAIVQHRGGALVPQGDHSALADALIEILTNPARAEQMGAANRERAVQRYALDRVIDRIEVTYDAVLTTDSDVTSPLEGVAHGS